MSAGDYRCLKCNRVIRHADAILLPARFDEGAAQPEADVNSGWMVHARCLGVDEDDLDLPDKET